MAVAPLPVALLGLDPLFWTHVKLFIADIHRLTAHPDVADVYCAGNHPLRRACVLGQVVALVRREKKLEFVVDDGTGLLPCTLWVNSEADWKARVLPELGALVDVAGRLSEFQSRRQLTVNRLAFPTDPNTETWRWLETIAIRRGVLAQPFELPADVVVPPPAPAPAPAVAATALLPSRPPQPQPPPALPLMQPPVMDYVQALFAYGAAVAMPYALLPDSFHVPSVAYFVGSYLRQLGVAQFSLSQLLADRQFLDTLVMTLAPPGTHPATLPLATIVEQAVLALCHEGRAVVLTIPTWPGQDAFFYLIQ